MKNIKYLYWELSGKDKNKEQDIARLISRTAMKEVILDLTNYEGSFKDIQNVFKKIRDFNIEYVIIGSIEKIMLINDIYELMSTRICKYIFEIDDSILDLEDLNISVGSELISLRISIDNNCIDKLDEILHYCINRQFKNFIFEIKECGKNRILPEQLYDVVLKLSDISKNYSFNSVRYNGSRSLLREIHNDSLVNRIFIDKKGYIGVYKFLPTYFENIYNGNIIEQWKRYIELYFQQGIDFILNKALLNENISDRKLLSELSMKNGFYGSNIPNFTRDYSIIKDGDMYNLYDSEQHFIIQINELGYSIIKSVNGKSSIFEITNYLSKGELDLSKAFLNVILFIMHLKNSNIIYFN